MRHHRYAYSAEQVLLNKQRIYGGAPKVNCYRGGSGTEEGVQGDS